MDAGELDLARIHMLYAMDTEKAPTDTESWLVKLDAALLAKILRELRQALEALYGERLVHLVLFGSQARGDAEPGSDIDVLVVLKGPENNMEETARVSDIVYDLSLQYNTVISCIFVDSVRYDRGRGPLIRNVRREGIEV